MDTFESLNSTQQGARYMYISAVFVSLIISYSQSVRPFTYFIFTTVGVKLINCVVAVKRLPFSKR